MCIGLQIFLRRFSENFTSVFKFFENAWEVQKRSVLGRENSELYIHTALLQLERIFVLNWYMTLKCK